MPILDLQRRARELGRIRIGHQVSGTNRDGKAYTRPEKLDRFRLTSSSQPLLEKVAELYGGTVAEWTPKGGAQQWEVITDARRIPILVPPQPLTQWHEYWKAGGIQHRCDGQTNAITGDPCDPEDPDHLEAMQRPTTRLNVVLRDVEGIGVWRLESHGWNAAIELPNAADFLAQAGGYIEGHLALEERTSKGENPRTGKPETRRFMVPIIEISVTPAELLAGHGSIRPPSIDGPVPHAALESGRPDYQSLLDAATTPDEVNAVWHAAKDAGHLDQGLADAIAAAAKRIKDAGPAPEPIDAAEVLDDPEADDLWQAVLGRAGELGMTLPAVHKDMKSTVGTTADKASIEQLQSYLEDLRGRDAA